MDKKGHIKVYRSITNWEWSKTPNTLALFVHCLLKANWKDGKFQGYDVPRGSFVTGRKKLAEATGLTEQQVRTALNHLKLTNNITIKTTNKFSVITIVNYDEYQKNDQQFNQQVTNKQPTNNQQITTIEEYKNLIKNSEGERIASPTPTLPEIISYGSTIGAGEEYCERFYNHYEAIGWLNGSGNKIKNWKLVLNNWFKKDLDKGETKDIRKKDIDPRRILEDEEGRLYQQNYDGTRYYI